MTSFEGTISGDATSPQYNLPMAIRNFFIANKSGVGITLNITIIGGVEINIVPYNLSLNTGDFVNDTNCEIIIPAGRQIKVSSTGNVSYYFALENLTAP